MNNEKDILSGFAISKPINKGHSGNKKYYVEAFDGNRYFLCIANISAYTHIEAVFKMWKTVK